MAEKIEQRMDKDYNLLEDIGDRVGVIFEHQIMTRDEILGVGYSFNKHLSEQTTIQSEKTISNYMNALRCFLEEYRPTIVNINRFIARRAKTGRSYYTIYVFKHLLEFLGKEQLYKFIIKPRMKVPKKVMPYVPMSEIKKMVGSIEDERFRLIAALQMQTGARSCEIINLKSNQVFKREDKIFVRLIITKTNISKTYEINYYRDELYEISKKKKEYMFLFENDRPPTFYKYYNDVIKKTFEDYEGFTTHGIRSSLITTLANEGVPLHKIQEFIGHKDLSTTARYDRSSGISSKEVNKILFNS